jgi:hypothetical protein
VILQADKAIAELRLIGLYAGDFTVPNNFDELLPEDILIAFKDI